MEPDVGSEVQQGDEAVEMDRIGKLNDGQVIAALNYMGICLFRYFPREQMIVSEQKTCETIGCMEVYRDAPETFVRECVCEDDQRAVLALFARIGASAGASEHCRLMGTRKRWWRMTLAVAKQDENHEPLEVVGLIEDISSDQAGEKSLINALITANQDKNERLESVLAGISGGFLIALDDEGATLDYCGEEVAALQGYSVEEFLENCDGKLMNNVYPPDREPTACLLAEQYYEDGLFWLKYRVRHRDGGLIWVIESGRRVMREDGSIRRYSLIRDVTAETEMTDQLQETAQAFQIAADAAGDIVFIFDAEKQEILTTESAADRFGVLKKYTGVPYESAKSGIVAESSREEYIRIHESIMDGAIEAKGVVILNAADGTSGVFELNFRAILDAEGNPSGKAVGVYKNITEHYEKDLHSQQEQRRQLEAIYALSMDYFAIFHINLEENTFQPLRQEENYPASVIGKNTYEEFLASYCDQMISPGDAGTMRKYADRKCLIEKLENRLFVAHEYRDSQHKWRRGRFVVESRDREGHARTVLFGVQVIDDEKKRELDYQEELKRAYEGANRANVAKTRFLSNMSHDIRTPMNSVIGFATIAANHPEDVEQVKDCLGKIINSGEHLRDLVDDVLDMSRIESGKTVLEIGRTTISEIVDDVSALIQSQAQNKGLHFLAEREEVRDEAVYADPLKIRQILINILGNSVKFTDRGGEVSLRVSQLPSEKPGYARYCFVTRDSGIGMSEEFLVHIFEPFERERNTTVSGIAGTGLGMAITKSLVDMMEGSISVRSAPGEGSEFTVELDLKQQEDAAESAGGEEAPAKNVQADVREAKKADEDDGICGFSGNRILVVEDFDLNREIAKALLSEVGLVVEIAVDGSEALEILREKEPGYYELILMDIQMPILNGYETTRAIRDMEREDLKQIPIVAMTANAFTEDVKAARAAGMNDHLAKPLDMKKVVATLHKYLK